MAHTDTIQDLLTLLKTFFFVMALTGKNECSH